MTDDNKKLPINLDLEGTSIFSNIAEFIEIAENNIYSELTKKGLGEEETKQRLISFLSQLRELQSKIDGRIGSKNYLLIDKKIKSLQRTQTKIQPKKKKITSLPYQIALLDHIGFFQLDFFKGLSQSKVDKITAFLLNTQERSVRGNRSALKDKNIGHVKYTSYKHINDIDKDLDNL